MKNNPIYNETQTFLNRWISLLIVMATLFSIYKIDTHFQMIEQLIFPILILVVVLTALVLVKLKTTIDLEGIHIQFFSFIIKGKSFLWDDIKEVYVRKYTVWEFGGWGFRFSGSGIAYTTAGIYGIQLNLKNGRKILIGIRNPKEIQGILTKLNQHVHKEMV